MKLRGIICEVGKELGERDVRDVKGREMVKCVKSCREGK